LGLLPALAAWLGTRPQAAPHFVADGFANAWNVPAGAYTIVFVPQVVRDASLLLELALLTLSACIWAALLAISRARRDRRPAA
jgi:hypothetical protein